MITAKVTLRRRGSLRGHIAKIEKDVKGPKAVKVGLPAGKAPGDLVDIAVWNHFGTSRGIPPRPYLTLAMFKNRGEIRAAMRKIAENVVKAKASIISQLPKLGMLGQGFVQKQIASNTPPPNAASTVRKKGSSKTLINTGRLRQSQTWVIDR